MTLLLLVMLLNQTITADDKADQLSEMVGKNFLDQVANKDWKRAAKLCAPTMNFDGEVITGEEKITERLKKMVKDHSARITFNQFYFFSGSEALLKFGPLPNRLNPLDLKKSSVLLGRRRKAGVAVILQQITDATGKWPRVVAITD
ncbi:hypothetical protein KKF84_17460 [Myxococcota bacterium]|nr:hypothetical protein [Myxococcota bacterium]MBU1537116.1 hypothetical protein [Myxococcota bacterium]